MAGLSVAIVTLLAALPWGIPVEARFLLPLLPYSVIHYWTTNRTSVLPEWAAFVSGLATDVLSHGPLGFWSLIFLLGHMICTYHPPRASWGAIGQWLQFALTIGVLALAQWLLASAYFLHTVDWQPLVRSGIAAALGYPVVWITLRALTPPAERREMFPGSRNT